MARQTENRMLDSQEACEELRDRYFDSAFKTAYSITGSYSDADALTRQLFENMEARFQSEPLPSVLELYILSQINLLYAKGDVQHRRTASAAPPTPAASPRPAEEPQPDAKEPTPEIQAEAPDAAVPPVPAPEPVPEPDSESRAQEKYDPRLTELWIPGSEQERQDEPAQASTPAMADSAASSTAEAAQEDNERSVPLTIVNTVLFLVLLGSAAFALAEMGLLKLLI